MKAALIAFLRRKGGGRIFAGLPWILGTSAWVDGSFWKDDQTWSDGA